MYKTLITLSFFAATSVSALAQYKIEPLTLYRPRIAEFAVETINDYRTNGSSELLGEAGREIERDRLYKIKLGAPLMIKSDRILGIQLKYYQQRFRFDMDDQPLAYDFFEHLDSRKFTSTGLRGIYQQDIGDNQKLTLLAGAELMSDELQWRWQTTKYFLSGIYFWQLSRNTKLGAGLVYNHVMGRPTFYPLFTFEKHLSTKWTLDLALPKSVAIRRNVNDKNFIIAKTAFRGWRYNLTNALPEGPQFLTTRKADLQFTLSWEREIHDWLWFGVDVGYTKNLRYYLANPGDRARDALIDLKSQDAMYTSISLFIVPPRRLLK
ncbi:MAG: DUF6268 family outer membrane beta-barrel protein [Cyclobacteriaceae bacterium]